MEFRKGQDMCRVHDAGFAGYMRCNAADAALVFVEVFDDAGEQRMTHKVTVVAAFSHLPDSKLALRFGFQLFDLVIEYLRNRHFLNVCLLSMETNVQKLFAKGTNGSPILQKKPKVGREAYAVEVAADLVKGVGAIFGCDGHTAHEKVPETVPVEVTERVIHAGLPAGKWSQALPVGAEDSNQFGRGNDQTAGIRAALDFVQKGEQEEWFVWRKTMFPAHLPA